MSWAALTQLTRPVYSSPWGGGAHRQSLPTLSPRRNWTRQERIHRKPTAEPAQLTPSMAFHRGRVWETESGSRGQESVLLRPHRPGSNRFPRPPRTHLSPGSPPAPPGRQLLPLRRLERSCPRRGRAPASVRQVCRAGVCRGREATLRPKICRLWPFSASGSPHCSPPGWADSHPAGSSHCARGSGEQPGNGGTAGLRLGQQAQARPCNLP